MADSRFKVSTQVQNFNSVCSSGTKDEFQILVSFYLLSKIVRPIDIQVIQTKNYCARFRNNFRALRFEYILINSSQKDVEVFCVVLVTYKFTMIYEN